MAIIESRCRHISIDGGSLSGVGRVVRHILPNAEKVVVLTDETVAKLYYGALQESLEFSGFGVSYAVLKNQSELFGLRELYPFYRHLYEKAVGKSDVVIALGGGSVASIAGFAAATYRFGINWVYCPTSSFGQCNGLLSGELGINFEGHRELIGQIWLPTIVIGDMNCLDTLPERDFRAGLVEIVKCALLNGTGLFKSLEDNAAGIVKRQSALKSSIRECLDIRMELATTKNGRYLFEIGRVFGKAFESVPGFDFFRGEADSVGLVYTCLLGELLGTTLPDDTVRLVNLLKRFGLPVFLPSLKSEIILSDIAGRVNPDGISVPFVSLQGIGNPRLESIPYAVMERFLPQIHRLSRDIP